MNWRDLLSAVWSSIRTHKLRSFLAIMGIIWGAYAVMMLFALGEGMFAYNQKKMGGLLSPAIVVSLQSTTVPYAGFGPGRQLTLSVAQVLRLPDVLNQVVDVSPMSNEPVTLSTHQKSATSAMADGVTPLFFNIFVQSKIGRALNIDDEQQQHRVTFLSYSAKNYLFGKQRALGKTVMIAGMGFKVVGYPKSGGQARFSNLTAYIPFSVFHRLFPQRVSTFVLRLAPNSHYDSFKKRLTQYLGHVLHASANDENMLQAWNLVSVANTISEVLWGIRLFLSFCGIMTLVVGGISIANMMYLVVKERTAEIGLLMALGAEPADITRQILIETIFLVGLGALIATGLACLCIVGLQHAHLPEWLGVPSISWGSMSFIIVILILTALLAGYFPARKAARMVPVDALQGAG